MAQVEKLEKDLNKYWEKMGIHTGSLSDVAKLIKLSFETRHVVCLIGEAGIGKTQIFVQIAEDLGYRVLFYYLAHLEREDIGGIPMPSEDKSSYRFLCEDSIREIIESDKPTILVLDEWNRGEKPVMNAAFTLMEQRRFGSHVLPDHVFIAAAMNPSEGSYLVNESEKDPAFRRRLCFVGVRADPAVWLNYARGRGNFHRMVTSYIESQPHALLDVESREAGKVYANPAAWEKVSDTLKVMDRIRMNYRENRTTLRLKLAGHIGVGISENFIQYLEDNATAVNPNDVVLNYMTTGRANVLALLKLEGAAKISILNELCESVAVTLAANEPDTSVCAENIANFWADLPLEVAQSSITKVTRACKDAGKMDFHKALNNALVKQPKYAEVLSEITNSHMKVQEDRNNKPD